MWPARAVFCLALAWGCDQGGSQALDWRVELGGNIVAGQVAVVEAQILRGGCSGEDALYRATFATAAEPPEPPVLEPGPYGFSAEVRDADCRVIGRGCTPLTLPAASSEVVVAALAGDGGSACSPEACTDGHCAQDGRDGAVPDASGGDGSMDAAGDSSGLNDAADGAPADAADDGDDASDAAVDAPADAPPDATAPPCDESQQIWIEGHIGSIKGAARACVEACYDASDARGCIRDCIVRRTGGDSSPIADACGDCVVLDVDCAIGRCTFECIAGSSSCSSCQCAQDCHLLLDECAGTNVDGIDCG